MAGHYGYKKCKENRMVKLWISHAEDEIANVRAIYNAFKITKQYDIAYDSNGTIYELGKDADTPVDYYLTEEVARYSDVNPSDGKYTGEYKEWWCSGNLRIQEYYTDGKINGMSFMWWPEGILMYKGLFINGEPDGEHVEVKRDGSLQRATVYDKGVIVKEYIAPEPLTFPSLTLDDGNCDLFAWCVFAALAFYAAF